MRQYISLMMVAARSRLWQVLLITAGTCAAEVLLFQRHLAATRGQQWQDLYNALNASGFLLVFAVGLVLVCLSLASFGMEWRGSKLGYTLRRLPCGEEWATLVFALHHFLCLLLFWGGQMVTAWVLVDRFLNTPSAFYADYTFLYSPLLLFYDCDLIHGILPGADWPIYIRNMVMLAALAMTAATCSYHWRRGSKPFTILPLSAFVGLTFPAYAGMFSLPGPGDSLPTSLPGLYGNPDGTVLLWGIFHLAIILLVLSVVTYNLLRRDPYVDV